MKYLRYVLILTFVLPFALKGDDKPANVMLADLNWLEGRWVGDFEGTPFEAYYTSAEGGAILSVSKEFLPDGRCFIEFEKFMQKDSQIVLTPYPNGKQSVDFILVDYDSASRSARFENLQHDFPTDITYRQITQDSMLIQVAGPDEDGRKALKVRLKRTQ